VAAAAAQTQPPAGAPSAALPADWVESVIAPASPAAPVALPPAEPTGRAAPAAAPLVVAAAAPVVAAPPGTRVARAPSGVYRAQFGAYRSGPDAARAAWSVLQTTHPGLKDLTPDIVRESFGDQMLWLLRTAPMDRDQVQRLCSDIRRAGDPCAVVRSATAASGAATEGGR
jgi:hypothetical protein